MKLQEVFDQIAGGELIQTNLGVVTEDLWPRLVMHINLGLADLFKRFFLREGRLTIGPISGKTVYPIDMTYAAANTRSKVAIAGRYIQDTADAPFINDVLKIEQVLTDAGFEFGMNDSADRYALSTPDTSPVTLRVPSDIIEQVIDLPKELRTINLNVVYRARHPKIDALAASFDPERYEVRLPDSHLQALLYYVASRVQGPLGLGQQEGLSSSGYWKRYESECLQLASAGVQIDRNGGYDKLRDRGFA